VLASAAFLYDVTAGRVLYAYDATAHLPMASTTKIMTAWLALRYGHLDDWVTASAAAATIGESTMYLQQGERLRLRDLLYGLLLPSGNDAAIAIAEHVGGSQQRFVAMMNREARSLGMINTYFVNPYGLDAPGHGTSARDLAVLTLAAMSSPIFRDIVSTTYYTIPATAHNHEHDLVNINQPLWWYPGIIGVKPGTTGAAGRCAVEWAARGKRNLLLVLLGDINLVTDVRDLLNWGFADFSQWYSPLQAPVVYAPEYFGWDSPVNWLATPGHGRYYVRTGHTVQAPMLAAYHRSGDIDRFGPPTSEEFMQGGLWVQRFTGAWLFYNPRTHAIATRAQKVQ
jgi:serine-type D-Ala-D-Ala carboxypeptidase (penicillin-binding protein 5/6)